MLERTLLVVTVLVALGAVYVLRDSLRVGIDRWVAGDQEPGRTQQAATPSPGTKQAARADRGLRGPRPTNLEDLNEPVSTTVIDVQIPPFPEATAVRLGMSKGEVVRRFGPPNWKAIWTESRTLQEKYAYVDNERATVMFIQAGKVVSSWTGPASSLSSASEDDMDRD